MRRFIHRENIKHYLALLETTTDENKRQTILKLLAEEEAQEEAVGVRPPASPPARAS